MEILIYLATIIIVSFLSIFGYEKINVFLRKQREHTNVIFPKKEREKIVITTPYVIKTHTDADGAGPAILAKHFFGKENVTIFSTPNNVMDITINEIMEWDIQCPTTIFITDISCSLETARKLEQWLKTRDDVKIVLLDHHKTALALNDVSFCKVMVEKDENSLQILKDTSNGYGLNCGTSLFYEYVTQELGYERTTILDNYVNIVTAYDTWMWETHFGGDELYSKWDAFFHLLGWDLYIEKVLEKIENNDLSFNDYDEYAFSIDAVKRDATIQRKLNQLYFIKWKGYNTCFVQVDDYLSDIRTAIFENYKNVDIVAMVTPTSVSLRSISDDVDVSIIAKSFGGGGHTQAAGFRIDWEKIKKYYWMFR